MARFVVARGGALSDETVEADSWYIEPCGALVFTVVIKAGRSNGTRLVHAFAPGRWVEVIRSELPQA